jgi:hypothetical protein
VVWRRIRGTITVEETGLDSGGLGAVEGYDPTCVRIFAMTSGCSMRARREGPLEHREGREGIPAENADLDGKHCLVPGGPSPERYRGTRKSKISVAPEAFCLWINPASTFIVTDTPGAKVGRGTKLLPSG